MSHFKVGFLNLLNTRNFSFYIPTVPVVFWSRYFQNNCPIKKREDQNRKKQNNWTSDILIVNVNINQITRDPIFQQVFVMIKI